MSKYTTEVRFICETSAGLSESVGADSVDDIIALSRGKIFNFKYPIFDETYRPILEDKILKHYYTREIAHESVGLWKLRLNAKMNDIMPYYNKMYQSELLTFNPLYDTDVTKTQKGNKNGSENNSGTIIDNGSRSSISTIKDTTNNTINATQNGTDEVTSNSSTTSLANNTSTLTAENTVTDTKSHKDKYSDTPQGGITDLESDKYLTNARIIDDENETSNTTSNETSNTDDVKGTRADKTTSTNSITKTSDITGIKEGTSADNSSSNNTSTSNLNKSVNSIEEYVESVSGKQNGKSYSQLLTEFRQTFLNIDMLIIDELNELFFNLW